MREITAEELRNISPALDPDQARVVADALNPAMAWAAIDTPERQAAFLAQWAHESQGFTRMTENLNYSAPGLLKIFRKYFTPAEAQDYAWQPERIANRVYADRLGNGDEDSGDGWRFRGRGYPQLTGRANYQAAGQDLALDLVNQPEMAESPAVSAYLAAWFWLTGGISLSRPRQPDCNEMADAGDFLGITKRINGGTIGLAEREAFWERAKEVLRASDG
jgi:putative chitinase